MANTGCRQCYAVGSEKRLVASNGLLFAIGYDVSPKKDCASVKLFLTTMQTINTKTSVKTPNLYRDADILEHLNDVNRETKMPVV